MRNLKPIDALFPKTRHQVLIALFLEPNKWWYLNELANHLQTTASTLQIEIRRLANSGILEMDSSSKRKFFRPNRREPYFEDLRRLIEKTGGIVDVVDRSLKPFDTEIAFAMIYGSVASSTEHTSSDVDLLLVTELGLSALSQSLKSAETLINREINTFKMSKIEVFEKVRSNSHFIETIIKSPKIILIAHDNDLAELFKEESNQDTRDQ